jgi:uncharacterized protein (TIGR04255 family)
MALQLAEPCIDLEILGLLASRLKEGYPVREQQPPLPPMDEPIEQFGTPQIELRFGGLSLPRTWFMSENRHLLIQAQSDRIALNWRRLAGDEPYPRYTALREEMAKLVDRLEEVLHDAEKAPPSVNFCELTYINEIAVPGVTAGDAHPDLGQILDLVDRVSGRSFLPQAEDSQFQARWRIPLDLLPDGSRIGRLYVAVSPALRADTQLPIYGMNLASRIVPPASTSLVSGIDVLDIGHDWIVRGFADLTTQDMHQQWKVRT